MPSPSINKPPSPTKVDRRLTSPDTFHENDTVTASYSGNDVETGVVTSGYLATGALSADEDQPYMHNNNNNEPPTSYMFRNVQDKRLPTSAELRTKKRCIGWMIFGRVMLGFVLVIGLVVGLQSNNDNVVVDPTIITAEEIGVDVGVGIDESVLFDEQLIDSMDEEESIKVEVGEDSMPTFEDSVISLSSSEEVDSSNDVSSDTSPPVDIVEEEVEDEVEEEASSPSFNLLDIANALDNEEEEETTSTHDHIHAHVGSNDIVSSDDTSEQHDTSNHNPFEPEVTIGDAALLNQIAEGNSTTSVPVVVTSEPTKAPTNEPTNPPSTKEPTLPPSPPPKVLDLSGWNVMSPTPPPTNKPVFDMSSWGEALKPTPPPSASPTTAPPSQSPTTRAPTPPPTPPPTTNPYIFGFMGNEFIRVPELGIDMSAGLSVKFIAREGSKVTFASGDESKDSWHTNSDAAGILTTPDGGYVYMSNSEASDGDGGVYGLYFNAKGEIVDYRALLTGTTDNCGGGITPWNTWVSCEETEGGQCWQVGPDGRTQETELGGSGGWYESVAVDDRVYDRPIFYTTEDVEDGKLRRYIASQHGWDALHGGGEESFLVLNDDRTYYWTTNEGEAENSAKKFFPNTEGIQVHEGDVYFMSKEKQTLIILDDSTNTWTSECTGKKFYGEGSFGGQPDQNVFGPTRKYVYFTEDGSSDPGSYVRYGDDGTYFTMFQAISGGIHTDDETIGIALSPDNKRFYAGFQEGYIFEFTRQEGLAFE